CSSNPTAHRVGQYAGMTFLRWVSLRRNVSWSTSLIRVGQLDPELGGQYGPEFTATLLNIRILIQSYII
ncbi:MAG: hypothetical protein ABI729_03020, partial [Chitinophagales bacterium]